MASDPAICLHNSAKRVAIVIDASVIHGFKVNSKKSNTECMFKFRGSKSVHVHNSVNDLETPSVPVLCKAYEQVCICATHSYLHMWVMSSSDNDSLPEMRHRS